MPRKNNPERDTTTLVVKKETRDTLQEFKEGEESNDETLSKCLALLKVYVTRYSQK